MLQVMETPRIVKVLKIVWTILVYGFALVGFGLVAGYFAVKFGLTNTTGIIDQQRDAFLKAATGSATSTPLVSPENLAADYPPGTPWQQTTEWGIINDAIVKDAPVINQAAGAAGVPARLIVANLVAEQLRLFFTDREDYKKFLYPLKILGPQTQFSWGVMGMKEATAVQVEQHLTDTASPYYTGQDYQHLLDFPASSTASVEQQRFTRMTDQHNHYYSYLYAGLYIRQIMVQWQREGHPIDNDPAVLCTLYNIGFEHSKPNANPQVGGAGITINGVTKSFGSLAAEFYNSDLLTKEFPK